MCILLFSCLIAKKNLQKKRRSTNMLYGELCLSLYMKGILFFCLLSFGCVGGSAYSVERYATNIPAEEIFGFVQEIKQTYLPLSYIQTQKRYTTQCATFEKKLS
jgi:hypothetical protein